MYVACIIPARNEASRVANVVRVASDSPLVDKVIVVDNASIDATARAAHEAGATVVTNVVTGKHESLIVGVEAAPQADILLFLDADLHGLTTDHIQRLIQKLYRNGAAMSCGTLDRPQALKVVLRYWAGFTGQRALYRYVWDALPAGTGFETEALLNSLCRKRKWLILREDLVGVTHTGKREKFSRAQAPLEYARTYGSAVKAYTRSALPRWGK